MGPKKGRRVRKIEVPTDSVPESELGDTVTEIHWSREERKAKEREEEAHKQREEARREESTNSPEEGAAEKHARTDKSDTELDTYTEDGGEAGTSQSHL